MEGKKMSTDKRLHFPSMDEGDKDDDSSDFFYQNERGEYERYEPPSWADDELDELDDDETEDGETGGDAGADYYSDSILDGERAAYERAKELTAGEDEFQYFPRDAGEETNRKFAMAHLQKEWGRNTSRNTGIARWFFQNFLDESLVKECDVIGIGSHPLMISAFYRAARSMEKQVGSKGEETKRLKFKGMNQIMLRKLEEKAKDLATRTYLEAKNEIIRRHGGISHRG
jgi:hypothetical protein